MSKMLDYQKLILQKVSFNSDLFQLEINKSFKYLTKYEMAKLFIWVKKTFGKKYDLILKTSFRNYFFF